MKLTKQKLEQLILQEMRHFRPPEFDPRLDKEYPQHSRALSDMYKSDIDQARSLSQGLRFDDELPDDEQVMEPIDVEVPETDEPDEKHLSYGIQQFRQESPVIFHGMHVGQIEIYFHTQEKKWFVNFFLGSNSSGGFLFNSELSKEFSNFEEAVKYYNWNAESDYVENNT